MEILFKDFCIIFGENNWFNYSTNAQFQHEIGILESTSKTCRYFGEMAKDSDGSHVTFNVFLIFFCL